jgi:hypothetical protein
MAKQKATITVDRAKLEEARALLGAGTASAAIDIALTDVIHRARLRKDVQAYLGTPPTDDEAGIGEARPEWGGLADDVDWEAEWPEPADDRL